MWGLAVMTMSLLASLWIRKAWGGVEVQARFEPERAFVGETVRIRVVMRNGKRLPLPFVRFGVWLPRTLEPVGEQGSAQIHGFRRRTSLGGYSEVVIDLEAVTRKRGEHHLRVIEVDLSDPFGLVPVHREFTFDRGAARDARASHPDPGAGPAAAAVREPGAGHADVRAAGTIRRRPGRTSPGTRSTASTGS